MTCSLNAVKWIHGAPDCARNTDPLLHVHKVDEDTFILRVSKCFSYEGNFIYLLFGRSTAMLLDTGGAADPQSHANILPLRKTIDDLVEAWLDRRRIGSIRIVVAHTHSHDDHTHWDSQFVDRPDTSVVGTSVTCVEGFFGLSKWPESNAQFELGERNLTILPIPGHDPAHIAVYDPRMRALFTGDTLYPGLLTVRDWPAYRKSVARLVQFADHHEIVFVLGSHVEMKNKPGKLYEIGTIFQPNEHSLPLEAAHLVELHAACEAMGTMPLRNIRDDFIIEPLD